MNEMRERVAESIHTKFVSQQVRPEDWPKWGELLAQGHQGQSRVSDTRGLADAAVAAMREPTDAMVKQGEMAAYEYRADPADWTLKLTKDAWQAMIDAALKD